MQIDADGRSWALMVDLLQRFDLAAHWDGDQRRVLIAASDVAPIYRDDAVQAAVGWPLVEDRLRVLDALCIPTRFPDSLPEGAAHRSLRPPAEL